MVRSMRTRHHAVPRTFHGFVDESARPNKPAHRARRRQHAAAQDAQRAMSPITVIPPSRQAGSDQQPADTSSWRNTIDGWVKNRAIRSDGLIALGMLLAAVIVVVLIVALVPVLSTTIGKTVAVNTVVATIVGAGWKVRRWRRHRKKRTVSSSTRPARKTRPTWRSCSMLAASPSTAPSSVAGRCPRYPPRRR